MWVRLQSDSLRFPANLRATTFRARVQHEKPGISSLERACSTSACSVIPLSARQFSGSGSRTTGVQGESYRASHADGQNGAKRKALAPRAQGSGNEFE